MILILSGLTSSPSVDAAWPRLLGVLQSARSIHFITAALLVAFFVIHILMLFLAGPLNEV